MYSADPVLIVENLLPVADCKCIVDGFTAALDAGKLPARGDRCKEVNLRDVAAHAAPAGCACKGRNYLRKTRDLVALKLAARFEMPGLLPEYSLYSRLTPGGFHALHADGVKSDGTPNHTPQRAATAMLYLTPQGWEFAGGQLELPEFGLSIDPQPGLLVGFPTTWRYRHEVKPVTRGRRDALVFWFTLDPRFQENWPAAETKGGAA